MLRARPGRRVGAPAPVEGHHQGGHHGITARGRRRGLAACGLCRHGRAFALAAASPTGGVLEANFHRSSARQSIGKLPGRPVEVFCRCPREVARALYRACGGRGVTSRATSTPTAPTTTCGTPRWTSRSWEGGPWSKSTRAARWTWPSCWTCSALRQAGEGRLLRRVDRGELRRGHEDVLTGASSVRRSTSWPGWRRVGTALELGIGTGRIALLLSQRGVAVHGIDLSPDMVAQLQRETGGRRHRRHARRLLVDPGGLASFSGRLSRLQHHREPDHPGLAGGVLLQRGGTPGAGRVLRHRGGGTPDPAPPARRHGPRPSYVRP